MQRKKREKHMYIEVRITAVFEQILQFSSIHIISIIQVTATSSQQFDTDQEVPDYQLSSRFCK